MKIALIGGTGALGEGLALRLCKLHDIIVGSRSFEKGAKVAESYLAKAKGFYGSKMKGSIKGCDNKAACDGADIAILTVPYEHAIPTIRTIKSALKPHQVIASPLVPMKRDGKALIYEPAMEGGKVISYAELVARELPENPVVAAFHVLPASKLAELSYKLDFDVPVAGDDESAVELVMGLIKDIEGLRPIYVGPLRVALEIEALTSLLVNAAIFSGVKEASVKFVT